jgi:hypothetical protein
MGGALIKYDYYDAWGEFIRTTSPSTFPNERLSTLDTEPVKRTSWDDKDIHGEFRLIYKWGTTYSPVRIDKSDIYTPAKVDRPFVCLKWNGEPDTEAVLQGTSYDANGRMLSGNCLKCKNNQDTLYLTGDHTMEGSRANYGTAGTSVGGAFQGLQFSSNAIPSIFADEDFQYINGVMARSVTYSRANQTKLKGICVGPCDPQHSIHDPINLLRTTSTGQATNGHSSDVYYLYGGTCRDSSYEQMDQPNIPAMFNNQVGNPCRNGFTSVGTGSTMKCVEEVPLGNIDYGSTYAPPSKAPDSLIPTYSCSNISVGGLSGNQLELIDNACFAPCVAPKISNGAYCVDPEPIIPLPSSVGCRAVPFTYDATSSGSSKTVKKWLCNTQDDLNVLIKGIETSGSTTDSSYIGPSDLVCVNTNPDTKTYYCQRLDEALADTSVSDTLSTDYQNVCDTLIQSYTDISDNITILTRTMTTAQTAQVKMTSIQSILDGVIRNMCSPGSASSTATADFCNTLNALITNFNSDINDGNSYISGSVTGPLNKAIQSRDALFDQINRLKCTGIVLPPLITQSQTESRGTLMTESANASRRTLDQSTSGTST